MILLNTNTMVDTLAMIGGLTGFAGLAVVFGCLWLRLQCKGKRKATTGRGNNEKTNS